MMNWLAVYRSERASLALRQPVLSRQEVVACESAVSLLQHLEARERTHEAAHAQALKDAHAQGFEQGRVEAMQMVQGQLLSQWLQVSQAAKADTEQLRQALIALSVQIVQRIAGTLAPQEVLLSLARQAVIDQGLGDSEQGLVLRVHSDWAEVLRARVALEPIASAACPLEVRADPTCGLMDLVIETPLGQVLAGLDAQLGRIAQNLREVSA